MKRDFLFIHIPMAPLIINVQKEGKLTLNYYIYKDEFAIIKQILHSYPLQLGHVLHCENNLS